MVREEKMKSFAHPWGVGERAKTARRCQRDKGKKKKTTSKRAREKKVRLSSATPWFSHLSFSTERQRDLEAESRPQVKGGPVFGVLVFCKRRVLKKKVERVEARTGASLAPPRFSRRPCFSSSSSSSNFTPSCSRFRSVCAPRTRHRRARTTCPATAGPRRARPRPGGGRGWGEERHSSSASSTPTIPLRASKKTRKKQKKPSSLASFLQALLLLLLLLGSRASWCAACGGDLVPARR